MSDEVRITKAGDRNCTFESFRSLNTNYINGFTRDCSNIYYTDTCSLIYHYDQVIQSKQITLNLQKRAHIGYLSI